MKSIRIYLIAALLSTVTLGSFMAAVHGYRASMRQAQALLDLQLADFASLLATLRPPDGMTVASQPSDRLAFQIWSDDGNLVLRSANSSERQMTFFEAGYRDGNFGGHRWRVLARRDAGSARWIMVAERIDIRIRLADQIILKSVLPIVYVLPLIGIIVWLVVGNGLSLVQKLARELRTRRADDLSRLELSEPPVELVPVVDAINDLLHRLDSSVQRERRFPADAAHELNTPLASIKVHAHNLQKELPRDSAELRHLERDVGRLAHLIEQMMLLYRTTPEHYQAQMRRVDLHAIARGVIGELYHHIDARQQSIVLRGVAAEVTGDADSLGILLNNLVLNASRYSPDEASIEVTTGVDSEGSWLVVTDTGPGIPDEDLDRVFDRFYRVGGDRHASSTFGCGLGLSIVRHIAELHRAGIRLANNADGPGLSVTITFPGEPGSSSQQDSS